MKKNENVTMEQLENLKDALKTEGIDFALNDYWFVIANYDRLPEICRIPIVIDVPERMLKEAANIWRDFQPERKAAEYYLAHGGDLRQLLNICEEYEDALYRTWYVIACWANKSGRTEYGYKLVSPSECKE